MTAPAPLEIPATLMFEAVVTIGVSAWAWSMATASGQPPARWGAVTMLGAFIVHRLAAALMAVVTDPNDVFDGGGQLLLMLGPFLGSILVFVGAPVVLSMAIPVKRPTPRPRE